MSETPFNTRNATVFLREFVYDSQTFRSTGNGQELEFCDGAIWIDDLLILYQLKERNSSHQNASEDAQAQWFTKKVERKAVDQLVASNEYLRSEHTLPLANLRGQVIDLRDAKPTTIHNIVIHNSPNSLPLEKVLLKGRQSQRLGFVHFMSISNYFNVVETLFTPYEVSDYLHFRAEACCERSAPNRVTEKALLGKYLSDTGNNVAMRDERYIDRLVDDRDQFSVGKLLWNYHDRVVWGNNGTEYHAILTEMAKLRRNMLRSFRERLDWAIKTCRENRDVKPSRFGDPGTGCSFIFIPLTADEVDQSIDLLQSWAMLSKYDLRTPKCIGLTVAADPKSSTQLLVNWCCLTGEWEHDPEFEALLAEDYPFREMRVQELGKYNFHPDSSQ